jgi:hypothetical protein
MTVASVAFEPAGRRHIVRNPLQARKPETPIAPIDLHGYPARHMNGKDMTPTAYLGSDFDELGEVNSRLPAENLARFGSLAAQHVDVGRPMVEHDINLARRELAVC